MPSKSSANPKPWLSGPKELLDHGLEHLAKGSEFDRRMALICIDNSVELIIKTFLGLPRRILPSRPSRKRLAEAFESFPQLLDVLEERAPDRLQGIDISDIDWYHTLRNELYHKGNGLTVEKQKVEVYGELAKRLYRNLFYGPELSTEEQTLVGRFLDAWVELESTSTQYAVRAFSRAAHGVGHEQVLAAWYGKEYEMVRNFRNNLVHGTVVQETHEIRDMTERLEEMLSDFKKRPHVLVEDSPK
jgi:hypothetical protein